MSNHQDYHAQIPLRSRESSPDPKHFTTSGYYPVPSAQQLESLHRKDSTLKRNIRVLKLIARVLTLLLSVYTTYSQVLTLNKYLTTRHIVIGGRNAWAANTKLWPTALLLSTSVVTVMASLITMGMYLCGIKQANKANDTVGMAASIGGYVAHMIVWISTAAAYRVGKDGHDLWGWTCSPKAHTIQNRFELVINFDRYCNIQSASWVASMAEAVLQIVTVTVYILAYRRFKHKKTLEERADMLAPVIS